MATEKSATTKVKSKGATIKKGRKEIEKKNEVLERLEIEYVPVDKIHPNEYNPNRQSEHDFELLLRSMREDGFTQPIICQKDGTIVDGEHRWRAAQELGFTEIPVVYVDMTPEQMRISTLRHNRARGSEDIELTAQLIRDLEKLGALDWAQDSLMLDDVEINRLLEDIPAPDALKADEFGQSWVPDIVGNPDREAIERNTTEAISQDKEGKFVAAMSKGALESAREREARIKGAKTDEDREQAAKDANLYRISMTFSGEEATIVKEALGKHPAEAILDMCKAKMAGGVAEGCGT